MKRLVLIINFLLFSCTALCQVPADTLINKLDSINRKTDSAGFQRNIISDSAYNETTKLRARDYFILLGSTVKQEFTKPFHMRKRDWIDFGKFAALAVSVGILDERIQKNALRLRTNNKFIRKTGKFVSDTGGANEVFTLAGFGLFGIITKNQKVKTTTLLATQAVITAALVETFAKVLSGRRRPNYYADNEEAEPRFTGPFGSVSKGTSGSRTNSSFPSGHATIAFAAATVFAVEYRNQPIIPIVAYSIASLVSVSRITENRHWASDVFVGAALGYVTGKRVSYNYHRLARIKNRQKNKDKTISLTFLNTDWGKMLPGITVKF